VPAVKPVATTPVSAPAAPLSLGPVGPKLASTTPASAPAPQKPAPAAPVALAPAATGGDGYAVQISASGSEKEARNSFAAAQRKYSALSGRSVEIQRADLGAKGVFYRTRVPAGSREQAAALCSQIQSQGGQCMVVKR
jgi:cell division septation protein DedD